MKTIRRPNLDRARRARTGLFAALALLCAGMLALSACNKSETGQPSGRAAGPEANDIVSRFRALDDIKDSAIQLRVHIQDQAAAPRPVRMTIYRRREADGGQKMVMDFSASPDERDRSAFISFGPRGEVEATRYVQSTNSFVTTTTVAGEDSLFGMTLQELADGQTEKYDYTLSGEDSAGPTPVYKVEGKLKQGAESKFPRLVMSLAKDKGTLQVAEFYDNRNELARRMTVNRLEEIGGHWTRMQWTVDNAARGKKLDFEVLGAKYDSNLSDSLFSKDYLKKISTR